MSPATTKERTAMRNMMTLAFDFKGRKALVALHTKQSPTDEEWAEYMKLVMELRDPINGQLGMAFTDGGSPNTKQRNLLATQIKGAKLRGVVLSSNAMVRGVVTALSWVNPNIKSFHPGQVAQALQYLNLPSEAIGDLSKVIAATRDQIRVLATEPLLSSGNLLTG